MYSSQGNFVTSRMIRQRLPKVCVAVTGADGGEMCDKAESIARDNPFMEFRLDYLKNPATAYPKIKKLLETRPEIIVIATCRRAVNGGKFRGSASAQADVLSKAAAAGCQMIDIEVESAKSLKKSEWEKLRTKAAVVLSYHDYKTSKKLDDTFEQMKQIHADFYKIVSTASSLYDNVQMMKLLERESDRYSMVGLCMGEQGIISRVLGVRAGSAFTFAAVTPGEETAPGQISARDLRDIYRIEQVDAATKVYGVVGDPVAHSLSPLVMNAAFRRESVHAVYLPLHAKKLEDLLECVREIPLHGLSVTMPYKEEILEHLDNTDELSTKVGACNTVIRSQEGRLYGFNTDVNGVVAPLESRMNLRGAKVLVLGAGGAARAAVFGLKARGAEVSILNRTPADAQKLARKAQAKTIKSTDLKKLQFDVIVNATSVGMGNDKDSPLAEADLKAQYVFDLIYTPKQTKLLRMAAAKGLHTISGSEMFVHQGARQFEIWTGKPAPVELMQQVVDKALETPIPEANGNGKQAKKKAAR